MCAKMYLLCLLIICVAESSAYERTRLTVKNGQIEGITVKTVDSAKPYYSFQGIPYATPPVGNLRFAAPKTVSNWNSVLDATKPKDTCIEIHTPGGSENCLYLNVYTPSLNKSLATIVWIHGGAFIFVYSNYTLNGVDFFMNEDVIFVTVHYRLGVFGFLSTEDDTIPGNFGLKDQLMAINWVHNNIKSFGGDPDKITVMGQSAGAVASSYMGMIPHLKGKLHGIIQQSGSSLGPFLGRYCRLGAYVLSTRLGMQSTNSSVILEALRQVDAEQLRNISLPTSIDVVYGTGSFHGSLYVPVLEPKNYESSLLTEMSHEQLRKGHFNKIPRLIGMNSLEGLYLIDEFNSAREYYSNYDQNIGRYIPIDMNTRNERVGYLIKQHYTNNTSFLKNISNAVHFGSDELFIRSILKDASLVSKHVPTYLYEFSYEGKLGNANRQLKGVSHGEELNYLFHDKNQGNISDEDKQVRYKLVKLWSNFAKYGNPTPTNEKLLDDQIWLPFNPYGGRASYMDIGANLVPSVNPHERDVQFWDNLYETYGNPPFDTY